MPNALTHKYVSDTILKELPDELKKAISPYVKEFNLGSLGPDIIMGLMFDKNPAKKNAGEDLHTQFVYAAFENAVEYFSKHKEEWGTPLFAYFMGFLTHYGTDSVVHPYVYEYTENRMRMKFDPILNNCLHTIVETEMDVYVGHYCLNGKNADTYYAFDWRRKRLRTVAKYFLELNKNVFHLPLTYKDIKTSVFFYTFMMRVCQRHKNGSLRFSICAWIDKRLKVEHLLMSALRPRALDEKYDYLNMNKTPYRSVYQATEPVKMDDYSFPELLLLAKEKGKRLIELASNAIKNETALPISEFDRTYNGTPNPEYGVELQNVVADLTNATKETEVKEDEDGKE